jgi:hypothetical protein
MPQVAQSPTVDLPKLKRRFDELRSQSSNARAVRAEIEKYVMPRIRLVTDGAKSESSATWRNPDRWDSTAPNDLAKLAAWLHGSMTPHGVQWFGGAFQDKELSRQKEAREWIADNARQLWQAYEESDFQAEMASAYPEVLGQGDVFITQEVLEGYAGRWGGFDFTAISADECEYEATSRRGIKTWWRELSWTPVQIVDHIEKHGGTIADAPKHIRDRIESGSGLDPLEVLFCVFERPDILRKPVPDLNAIPSLRPYGTVYFLKQTCERIGEEGGSYEQPVFLASWDRNPGSRWSVGLGHLVLSPAKFVNAWLELTLTEGALAVQPPILTTEDGIVGDVEFKPKGIIQVRSIEDLKVLQSAGQFDVATQLLMDQRLAIGRILKSDQLDLKDSPQMTATEFTGRLDRALRLLGPNTGRIQSEVLDQMLLSGYRSMFRAGRFPKAPPSVLQKGEEFNFVYLGPTARARRMDEVAAIERGAAFAAGLMKMSPAFEAKVKHAFKPVQAMREAFERLGVPDSVLSSESEARSAAAAEAQFAERMAQAEAARAEGEAIEQAAAAAGAAGGVTTPMPAQPNPVVSPTLPF